MALDRISVRPRDKDGYVVANPLEQYKIADLEESTTSYFGFTDTFGQWYIMKLTATEGRYVRGDTGYTTAWTNRAALTYDYLYEVF